MRIEIVAALDQMRVIGGPGGGIPWDLPKDVACFRELARGEVLVVGRRTFEEMKGWFNTEVPIVMTRQPDYIPHFAGALVAGGKEGALDLARRRLKVERVMVIGGAEVYEKFLGDASVLHLTRVEGSFEGEAKFPEFEEKDWKLVARSEQPADESHEVPFAQERWQRRSSDS